MTVHLLAVESRDVAAEALGLLLDAPAPPSLAQSTVADDDGGVLILGVLAASHVVTATRGPHRFTEQVSCDALAAGGQQLPQCLDAEGYSLTTRTAAVPSPDLTALADRLRERAQDSPAWVCGTFPGADTALTAMTGSALAGGGWSWQTWHLYPDSHADPGGGVVVETSSRWRP